MTDEKLAQVLTMLMEYVDKRLMPLEARVAALESRDRLVDNWMGEGLAGVQEFLAAQQEAEKKGRGG